LPHFQLVAYNKVDVPDSGVFWEDVREGLLARGADPSRVFAISAATGSGVTVSEGCLGRVGGGRHTGGEGGEGGRTQLLAMLCLKLSVFMITKVLGLSSGQARRLS
jgi:hypothetical protein